MPKQYQLILRKNTDPLFDEFDGSSIVTANWDGGVPGGTKYSRDGDIANSELNGIEPENVTIAGSNLAITTKLQSITSGDRDLTAPHARNQTVPRSYTSGQIASAQTFTYGTFEARIKLPATSGVWPCFWILGFEWQASQPYTANVAGHNWPHAGWYEIDIAEFHGGGTASVVSNNVHCETGEGFHDTTMVFDGSTRFMKYRLQWTATSLTWSYDAEDGAGYRTTRTKTGTAGVDIPNLPGFIVFNCPVGGNGSGTVVDGDFPKSMLIDWVRVTQP